MSEPENFVSRWWRLKRESELRRQRSKTELHESPAPSIAAVITADTDIHIFLQTGVPAKLTEAALRRAWMTDPAIRDFIGIAENQWDFTDPTTIPGFGPLQEADDKL